MGGWVLVIKVFIDFPKIWVFYQAEGFDSKYGVKSCLQYFYQKLGALSISNFGKLRSITHMENGSKNSLTENASQTRGKDSEVLKKKSNRKKCDFRCKNIINT